MIKNKKDVLEDCWNVVLGQVVDSEIKIKILKTKKKDEVMYSKEVTLMGRSMEKPFTAGLLLEQEETAWRGKIEMLDAIKDLLKKYDK